MDLQSSSNRQTNIAFLGNKQSGKTTLVNTLLLGKPISFAHGFSSLGINVYRVVVKEVPSTDSPSQETSAEENSRSTAFDVVAHRSREPSSPLLPTATNAYIVLPNFRTMHEMTMDVPLRNTIFNSYPDTSFVLTDIPGINIQDPQDIYLHYVNTRWESFDCVVIVLNALEELSEQLDLLHLVKENLVTKGKTHVVFVCNKVDDAPMNQEVMTTLEQLRKLVWSIFMTTLIPLSAENAFSFCYATDLTLPCLQKLYQEDRELFETIGGRIVPNWRNGSHPPTERTLRDFRASIENEVFFSRNLAISNYPSFLAHLKEFIENGKDQESLSETTPPTSPD